MELILIFLTAFATAVLTLFSGFGLGTLLLPAFAMFFPVPLAVAATAVVHLLNNIYKAILLGRYADKNTLLRFGVPSAIAAFAGAYVLSLLAEGQVLFSYQIMGTAHSITIVKAVIGLLMLIFALFELLPFLQKLQINSKYLSVGGVLSGFFGGLSGHQGALRTAFLLRSGLGKNELIGTLVIIAVMVDVARIGIYSSTFLTHNSLILQNPQLLYAVLCGCTGALAGTTIGRRLFEKTTIHSIQQIAAGLILVVALLLGSGLI